MRRLLLACALAGGCGWPTAEPERTWTVQRGESLSGIAQRHGTTVEALRAANDLSGNLIHPGDVLVIPGDGPTPAAPPPRSRGRTRAATGTTAPPPAPTQAHGLSMPSPEPCLDGPSADGLGDAGAAASEGLSAAEVSRGVSAVMPHTGDCLDGAPPAGRLLVSLTIGCNGVVSDARIAEDPGWPPTVRDCVVDVLRHADFPPHALPDGETVLQPVSWGP